MSRKNFLQAARLYLVLDAGVRDYLTLFAVLKEAVAGGIDIVQLRDKKGTARDIIKFSRKIRAFLREKIPFIVNDRLDLAKATDADGVHLGQEDLPVGLARKLLGPKMIIGASCQTLAQARSAQKEGADYIGFGSVFRTLTKPDRRPMDLRILERVNRESGVPVFAIGGIRLDNVEELTRRGVHRVAVTRALCETNRVRQTAETFKQRLMVESRP